MVWKNRFQKDISATANAADNNYFKKTQTNPPKKNSQDKKKAIDDHLNNQWGGAQ